MEPEVSWESAIGPYPEPDESSPKSQPFFPPKIHFIVVLPSTSESSYRSICSSFSNRYLDKVNAKFDSTN
jgi:hypothetical protein